MGEKKITFLRGVLIGEGDVRRGGTISPADNSGLTDVRVLGHGVILVPWLLNLDVGLGLLDGGNVLVGRWVEIDDGDVILIHHLRRARGADCDLRHGRAGRID